MANFQTIEELTEKLISLPSYVSSTNDETPLANFLYNFLLSTFPTMIVEKQYLNNSKRYNLILRGQGKTNFFVLGHLDTVQPKSGWETDPLVPVVKTGKLYGLGAADMKGSLAAFLWSLIQLRDTLSLDNLLLLLYIDEEYDFLGMKRFLSEGTINTLSPALTLSLDGELAVATGCRGLIELQLTFKGRSGHAANPMNGMNAITASINVLDAVSCELAIINDTELGPTTTNVAYIQGGTIEEQNGQKTWLQEGNVIADTAEVIFEVRPSVNTIYAPDVLARLKTVAHKRGLDIAKATIRHNIAPWPPSNNQPIIQLLKSVYQHANVPFKLSDRTFQGYIDAHMIAEKILAPTFIIGTGGEHKHGANENVSLDNLEKTVRVYTTLLQRMLS